MQGRLQYEREAARFQAEQEAKARSQVKAAEFAGQLTDEERRELLSGRMPERAIDFAREADIRPASLFSALVIYLNHHPSKEPV